MDYGPKTSTAPSGTSGFGDGSDGALVYDGAATILGMAPAANVYTLTRDIFATNLTVNAGVTIKTNNFRIFATGTLTLVTGAPGGIIQNDGNAAVGATGGTSTVAAFFAATINGASGVISAGQTVGATPAAYGGAGGAGGNGTGGAGGAGGGATLPTASQGSVRDVPDCFLGCIRNNSVTTIIRGGGGGGSGSGDNTAQSGGGGGTGGGIIGIYAKTIVVNAGAIIRSAGGAGAAGTAVNCGGGGGGGGGLIILVYNSYTNNGTVSVPGGAAGAAGGGTGLIGVAGSVGTIVTINNNA